jgi:integrase
MRARITAKLVDAAKPKDKPYLINDTQVKGFCLRVEPSGTKSYFVRYRIGGRQTQMRIADAIKKNAGAARMLAITTLAKVADGIDPQLERKRGRARTLRDFLKDHYRPWMKANRKSGEEACQRIEAVFSRFLDKPMSAITPRAMDHWCSARRDKGAIKAKKAPVKPSTIQRDVAALKAALGKAVAWGFLGMNPLSGYKAGGPADERVRYLSPDEELRLLDALERREEALRAARDGANAWRRERGYREMPDLRSVAFAGHLKPMVLISLLAGLRRGELFGLEWRDVDFEGAVLTVRGETSKTGKRRHVPLTPQAVDVFRGWRAQTDSAGLVFVSPETGGRFDNVNRAWRSLLEDAGITDFRWHDMRHHYASKLVSAGASLYAVQSLLGHSSPSMTVRYSHIGEDAKAEAVRGLILPFPKVS